MRLVEGPSPGALLRENGALAPQRAGRLLSQVAAGLDTAHACGMIHRDVKPAKVLVAGSPADEHAYPTDFGIAKRAGDDPLTAIGQIVGTLDYIAPEVLRGAEAGGS